MAAEELRKFSHFPGAVPQCVPLCGGGRNGLYMAAVFSQTFQSLTVGISEVEATRVSVVVQLWKRPFQALLGPKGFLQTIRFTYATHSLECLFAHMVLFLLFFLSFFTLLGACLSHHLLQPTIFCAQSHLCFTPAWFLFFFFFNLQVYLVHHFLRVLFLKTSRSHPSPPFHHVWWPS